MSNEKDPILLGQAGIFHRQRNWQECLRRVPRVEIGSDAPVKITLAELSPHPLAVKIIGELGAYCVSACTGLAFHPDHVQDIILNLGKDRFELEGTIRYTLADGLALAFHKPIEQVRDRIRSLFGVELLAKSLAPIFTDSSSQAGLPSFIYSDGDLNRLQITIAHGFSLHELSLDLGIIGVRAKWKRNFPLIMSTMDGHPVSATLVPRILSFVRNLPDLDRELLASIETVFSSPAVFAKCA